MIFEKVREFVSKQLDIDPEKITLESALVDDLKADSLDIIELIMDMEQEFNIQIDDDDLESIRTIGDVVERLEALKK